MNIKYRAIPSDYITLVFTHRYVGRFEIICWYQTRDKNGALHHEFAPKGSPRNNFTKSYLHQQVIARAKPFIQCTKLWPHGLFKSLKNVPFLCNSAPINPETRQLLALINND